MLCRRQMVPFRIERRRSLIASATTAGYSTVVGPHGCAMSSLRETARELLPAWGYGCSHHRPHGSLRDLVPSEFAARDQIYLAVARYMTVTVFVSLPTRH